MKCRFINLDRAEARRTALEASFRAAATPGWDLVRVAAIDAATAELPAGKLSDVEKAVYLSHKQAIAEAMGDDEAAYIVEDDVVFSSVCFRIVDQWMARDDWDVIFTECLVPDFNQLVIELRALRKFKETSSFSLVDLTKQRFSGANAYILSPGAKRKVFDVLDRAPALDVPCDILLRRLVNSERLKGFVAFPRLTSLAPSADVSQVQPGETSGVDFVLNALRRLLYVESDPAEHRRAGDLIAQRLADEDSLAVGRILAGVISQAFPDKR